jgi:hypothetical protein
MSDLHVFSHLLGAPPNRPRSTLVPPGIRKLPGEKTPVIGGKSWGKSMGNYGKSMEINRMRVVLSC